MADASEWLELAKQARAIANAMNDPVSKQHMLEIAANYDALAERDTMVHQNFQPVDNSE
jgi:hypothetical protein